MKIQFALLTVNAFNFYRGNVLDFAAPIMISFVIAYLMDLLLAERSVSQGPDVTASGHRST